MKICKWFIESRRWLHTLLGLIICLDILFAPKWTVPATVCFLIGFTYEYKDKESGNKFDWLDWFATSLPGIIISIILYVTA